MSILDRLNTVCEQGAVVPPELLRDTIDRLEHLEAEITWLRNQMGDIRGMQTDGATPEEMDHALGRALRGERARLKFDQTRVATDEKLNDGENHG